MESKTYHLFLGNAELEFVADPEVLVVAEKKEADNVTLCIMEKL